MTRHSIENDQVHKVISKFETHVNATLNVIKHNNIMKMLEQFIDLSALLSTVLFQQLVRARTHIIHPPFYG